MSVKAIRRKLSDYILDPANPRKPTPRGASMLESSIEDFGPARSGVVDKDGIIRAGNQTAEQLMAAGIEDVIEVETTGKEWVIVRRKDMDAPTGKRYAIADNRTGEIGDWNADVLQSLQADGVDLARFFDADELDALLAELGGSEPPADPGAQVDKAAELQAKWNVQRGDLWQIGRHRLLCGDSTVAADVARVMVGERADCVFTSPPYGVGIDYGTYEDTIDNLRAMLPKLSKLWCDVVEDGGFAVVNFGDIAGGRDVAETTEPCEYPMALEYWPVFRADGWLLWSRRIWCKPNERVNSLWCIQSNRAATDWEHLWTWRKPGQPIVKRVDGEYRSPLGWYQSSLMDGVEIGKETHGAGMALGIAEWMLTVHSRPNRSIFEPFTGTGTTLVACERTGRVGRGIEISEKYCSVTLERLSLMGLSPVRVSNG